jgi:hypothetical protein
MALGLPTLSLMTMGIICLLKNASPFGCDTAKHHSAAIRSKV